MMLRAVMALILVLGAAAPSVSVSSEQAQITPQKEKPFVIRPDLVAESINFSTSVSGKMLNVTITGNIYNDAAVNSWCCPTDAGKQEWSSHPSASMQFEWKKYVRSYPNGRWTQLGSSVGTMLKAHERQNYNFSDSMPVGTQREYKIVLDTENWINETNKDNNTKTRIYSYGK